MIEGIRVKNRVSYKKGDISINITSNSTVWELKKQISNFLDLAPKYLKLENYDDSVISDNDNGKTIGEIGLKQN